MSRILVAGLCPLPFENTRQSYGPGIRSWQLALPLARAGHEVRLVAMQIPNVYDEPPLRAEEVEGVQVERWTDVELMDPDALRRTVVDFAPDAVVGATVYGSFALAQLHPQMPFWADQFGHVMAEAQAKAAQVGANWPLAHFWNMVRTIGLRADRLSVVSQRQRWAAVGELGAMGRLTAETCGEPMVEVIPCALVPADGPAPEPLPLRGDRLPESAFVALWSGGYNVWSDVETLFEGLEAAMRESPSLYLLSTGGEIRGHDETTYARFRERIASSAFRERFLLEGWVEADLVPRYQAVADLGVLSEHPIYEGALGSKNRIIQWMGAGLPVAYNRVGGLGETLAREGLGLIFEPGEVGELRDRLLEAGRDPESLRRLAVRARDWALEHWSFEATTRELVAWAAEPHHSRDLPHRGKVASPTDFTEPRQQVVQAAMRLPFLRRNPALRRLWRALFARRG